MTPSSAVVDVPLELPATRKFRQCGTPGCSLQDYHFGPCRIVEPSAEDLDADDGGNGEDLKPGFSLFEEEFRFHHNAFLSLSLSYDNARQC